MLAAMATGKLKLEERLAELEADRADVRQAIKNILMGKAQSYGIGSRNKAAYDMTLSELRVYEKEIKREISSLENRLNGGGSRFVSYPTFVDPV